MSRPASGGGREGPAGDRVLARVLAPDPPPFAVLHRPHITGPDRLEVLTGTVTEHTALADLALPAGPGPGAHGHQVLAMVPFRQITERGYACVDDGAPLLALAVEEWAEVDRAEFLARLPEAAIRVAHEGFDLDDDAYAAAVQRVITEEIGRGEGANFVLRRRYRATLADFTPRVGLALFGRLAERETGAYWTFVVHTGARTFVGATPERHVTLAGGTAAMNPISGTHRYPADGPTVPALLEFLADTKETEELYMVVDEELKMMARICDADVRLEGPRLREMSRLAHTEYHITGRSSRDPRTVLRETMFAPTVTGSPLENACRVISRHETGGRGYYSGVAALIGRDGTGAPSLDSAIVIRTAEIEASGRLSIGVGATVVRHSDARAEARETRAKAAGLLAALGTGASGGLGGDPRVRAALDRRNDHLARFWLAADGQRTTPHPVLSGRTVLVVDAEDVFTAMLAQQLRAVGLTVTTADARSMPALDGHDLVLMGPGPGDPASTGDPRIVAARTAVRRLLRARRPFLAVCLSHQILCRELGFELVRRAAPNQGAQAEIDLFGVRERVGFYNSFAARSAEDKVDHAGVGPIEVSRDPATGEVHALRGDGFASVQFHAESVLTTNGTRLLGRLLSEVLRGTADDPSEVAQ
ncbi:phenazine biosynthesis protein PhzE [Streptomyces amakusaensis]|uniref:anthranilate synthase n=1 Tax=Streptomyces amakusaensis TaxID=67271 RepID=A0ABW0AHI3_9ACTN